MAFLLLHNYTDFIQKSLESESFPGIFLLEQVLLLQEDGQHNDDGHTHQQRHPPELIQGQPAGDVHAEVAENDVGHRHENGDRGEHLHNDVQVVGDH